MAQTDIMALQANLLGKESIIREWRDDFSVAFVIDPSGDGYFALINPGLTTIKTAKIPSGDLITDFRIHNDSVFFCGSRRTSVTYPSGMPQGFVGCFDIQQVFSDADPLNYYLFPYTNYPGDHYITVPQRMDLYQVGSTTHIALVSKCELYPMMGVDHRTTLCDVACPVNGWSYYFFFNKDGIEYYTDIVTNPNYVVAVARDTLFQKCFIDVFFANGQFVSNPLLPNNTFVLTDVPPIDDIRVDYIAEDKFVLAYQYKNSSHAESSTKAFHIDPYTSTILIGDSYATPHSPTPLHGGEWVARDMNSFNHSLSRTREYPILQDHPLENFCE